MNIFTRIKQQIVIFLDFVTSILKSSLIFYFPYPERKKIFVRMFHIKRELHAPAKTQELYQLHVGILETRKVKGDIAEVGVYKGTTAKAICEAKGNRPLHLFDTFEGLPTPQKIDKQFYKGEYAATLESVKSYLSSYPNVHYYKGLFPGTGARVKNKKFSFVHLDVDLYKSTKDALAFFYPRMTKGGIIISHDYVSPGIRKAFDEFFADKPEPIIELPGIQVMTVKV